MWWMFCYSDIDIENMGFVNYLNSNEALFQETLNSAKQRTDQRPGGYDDRHVCMY